MFPYRPQEIFAVNTNLGAEPVSLSENGLKVITVDNFYADPDAVRDIILKTPYPIWKHNDHSRNFIDYYDCRQSFRADYLMAQAVIREIALDILGIEITRPETLVVTNLFRLIKDAPADGQAHPHDDGIKLAAVLTLNTPEECSGGTAFYQSRTAGIDCMPIDGATYKRRLEEIYQGENYEDGTNYFMTNWRTYWDLIDMVPMKYNRLVIYPGVYFHGAWHEPNAFTDHWRINQAMFFNQVTYHRESFARMGAAGAGTGFKVSPSR